MAPNASHGSDSLRNRPVFSLAAAITGDVRLCNLACQPRRDTTRCDSTRLDWARRRVCCSYAVPASPRQALAVLTHTRRRPALRTHRVIYKLNLTGEVKRARQFLHHVLQISSQPPSSPLFARPFRPFLFALFLTSPRSSRFYFK